MYRHEIESLLDGWNDQREQVEISESDFLRHAGWEYTCQTPGSYWMWTKKIEDKTLLVDRATALNFELAAAPVAAKPCRYCGTKMDWGDESDVCETCMEDGK